jgi:hypothetical protein
MALWSADALADALDRCGAALYGARTKSTLETVIAERLILEIATLAPRARSRPTPPARPT